MKKSDVERIIKEEMDKMSEAFYGRRRGGGGGYGGGRRAGGYSSYYDAAGFPRYSGPSREERMEREAEINVGVEDEPRDPPPPRKGSYSMGTLTLFSDPELVSVYGTDIASKLRTDAESLSTYRKGYAGISGQIITGRHPEYPSSTVGGPHKWSLTKTPEGFRFDVSDGTAVTVTATDMDPVLALRMAATAAVEGGLDFPGAELILSLLDKRIKAARAFLDEPPAEVVPPATPMSEPSAGDFDPEAGYVDDPKSALYGKPMKRPAPEDEPLNENRWAKMAGILRS